MNKKPKKPSLEKRVKAASREIRCITKSRALQWVNPDMHTGFMIAYRILRRHLGANK